MSMSDFNKLPGQPSGRVLVVEDDPTQSLLLRQLLTSNGFRPITVPHAEAAIETIRQTPFDLVLSDVEMPGQDGYQMCSAIKSDPALCQIPIILLTSLNGTEDLLRGLEARADYYITKPYNPAYLIERIRSLLTQTPYRDEPPGETCSAIRLDVDGHPFAVTAGRRQMLNLLLCTYECALLQNRQLTQIKRELNERSQLLREQARTLQQQQEELQRANAQLQALATTDGLTGVNNHRTFQEHLALLLDPNRPPAELSLILLDVDHFKAFNDDFGHQAGDEVLQQVAAILRTTAREADLVARYGGEEFVVILPRTHAQAALSTAERLRQAIESGPWTQRAVTASFGVTTRRNPDCSPADLIEEADQALYRSKRDGRNRITHAHALALQEPVAVPA